MNYNLYNHNIIMWKKWENEKIILQMKAKWKNSDNFCVLYQIIYD